MRRATRMGYDGDAWPEIDAIDALVPAPRFCSEEDLPAFLSGVCWLKIPSIAGHRTAHLREPVELPGGLPR